MKTIKLFLSILFLAFFSGCDEDGAREIKQEAEKMITEAKNHLAANKDAYVKKVETELAELDEEIKNLNKKAESAGARTRVEIVREIQELSKKRDAVRKNLDRLKSASAGTFKQVESEVDHAMSDLKKSYGKTRSRFE